MIRKLLASLAFLAIASAAHSQTALPAPSIKWAGQFTVPTPTSIIGYDSGTGLPCIVGSTATCAVPTGGTVAAAPYVFTSTGFQQLTGVSTATGFTPPATSTVCFITTETVAARYRTDGTNPTASVGSQLAVGNVLVLTASLATVKLIPVSGSTILDIDCYK